jgi:multicomponent Na+:H+ antiporter subunit E
MTILRRGLFFALVWLVLTAGRADGLVLGTVAVAVATWASLRLLPSTGLQLSGLPGFLGFFLVNSVRGGMQVATMALRGRSALRPGVVEVVLALPPGLPRAVLTGTLGLMPGTLGLALDGAQLRLHVLDTHLPVAAEVRALEERIARLFGEAR